MSIVIYHTNEHQLLKSFLSENIAFSCPLPICADEENFICFMVKEKCGALYKITSSGIDEFGYHIYPLELIHITEMTKRKRFPGYHPPTGSDFFLLTKEEEQSFLNEAKKSEYSLHFYLVNGEEIYESEKLKAEKLTKKAKQAKTIHSSFHPNNTTPYKNISDTHLRAQFILKEIGLVLGYDTFVAKNDQHRFYKNQSISYGTIPFFPNFGLPKEVVNHISLIDAIWFHQEQPVSLFEIECSTSISSGMTRMGDVLCAINNPNIQLYIVTERNRAGKVKKEFARPIFQRINLSQQCKVIFIEDLEILYDIIRLIPGYVKLNILDRISFSDFHLSSSHFSPLQESRRG